MQSDANIVTIVTIYFNYIILVHPKDNVEDSRKTSTIKPKAIVKFKERFQNAFYLHALLNYPMLMIYRAHT